MTDSTASLPELPKPITAKEIQDLLARVDELNREFDELYPHLANQEG